MVKNYCIHFAAACAMKLNAQGECSMSIYLGLYGIYIRVKIIN